MFWMKKNPNTSDVYLNIKSALSCYIIAGNRPSPLGSTAGYGEEYAQKYIKRNALKQFISHY